MGVFSWSVCRCIVGSVGPLLGGDDWYFDCELSQCIGYREVGAVVVLGALAIVCVICVAQYVDFWVGGIRGGESDSQYVVFVSVFVSGFGFVWSDAEYCESVGV